MRKKKRITLIILVLLSALTLGGYIILLNKDRQGKSEEGEKEASIPVTSLDSEKIAELSYASPDGEIHLIKENDTWKLLKEKEFPVNQTYVEDMIEGIVHISSTREIKGESDLSQYGIKKPSLSINVRLKDGDNIILKVGYKVPGNGGYYMKVEGKDSIYVVSDSVYTPFSYKKNELMALEDAPSLSSDNITKLSVKNGDRTFEMEYKDDQWTILKPYESKVPANYSEAAALLDNYSDFTYKEGAEYKAYDLTEYGLNKPAATVTVSYTGGEDAGEGESDASAKGTSTEGSEDAKGTKAGEAKTEEKTRTYTLLFGKKTEDGDYFVRMKGQKAVYIMDGSTAEGMIDINPFDYAEKLISTVDISTVKEVQIKSKDSETSMVIKEDGDKTRYLYNKKEMEETEFKSLYTKIIGMQIEREIPSDYHNTGKDPLLSVVFHKKSGKDTDIEYYEYDKDYAGVSVDGSENFLVDLRRVNDLIKELKEA